MDTPSVYNVILALVRMNGGVFRGKTNVHKNLYLIGEMLRSSGVEVPYKFRPYYYGPYSADISDALDLLVGGSLLQANDIELSRDESIEIKQTLYQLTERGKEAADAAIEPFSDFFDSFRSCFDVICNTGHHETTRIMATAAKIKLILSREKDKPFNNDDLKSKASDFGWKLNGKDISASINVLKATGLAKTRSRLS
ncbi:MAG: hypothetical protein KAW61_04085 [candidate division Zixibacteria bacterium]|jgi:hypothetical protein|nr:hypothetical protein [candidate division Zixibacteria bacterium]